jgi:peroxiredoxin
VGGVKDKVLQTTGPYSITRNPLYVGGFCFALSIAFFLKSSSLALLTLAASAAYVRWVVPAEEEVLESIFGEAFREYKRRTPRRGFHMRSDIVPGAIFPDYELSDHTAKRRKLSELQGQHPMVLVLSRGGFCPKDRRQAEGLVQLHRELEVAYCRLVTISTDNITQTNEYRSGVGAHWPFLSDAGRIVQKDLDIAEYTDPLTIP